MTRRASETLHPILENVRRRGVVSAIETQSDFRRTEDTAGVTGANANEHVLERSCERRPFASSDDRHGRLVSFFFDTQDRAPCPCVVGVDEQPDARDDGRPALGRDRGRSRGIFFLRLRRLGGLFLAGVTFFA
jgi:hypothetical protein